MFIKKSFLELKVLKTVYIFLHKCIIKICNTIVQNKIPSVQVKNVS